MDERFQNEYCAETEQAHISTKNKLECWEKWEEIRVGQLAKNKKLKEGDQKSKLFQAVVNKRRHDSHIDTMQLVDGMILATPVEGHEGVINYFYQFLYEHCQRECLTLSHIISKVVTEEEIAHIMHFLRN